MTSRKKLIFSVALLFASIVASSVNAEVRLPNTLSSHAVLQREAPIHIWGWADPNETVTVRFHDQTRSASTNSAGEWGLWLMPEHAGGPYTLTVQGSSTVTLSDILIGDVWLASGQSNMEIPLNGFPGNAVIKNAQQEIAQANLPTVRLLRLAKKTSDFPLNDISATWTACTPQTAAEFSAVAYFFGRDINAREHVPIGLIDSTWGGTPVESWISLDGIAPDAGLMPIYASLAEMAREQNALIPIIAKEKQEDEAAAQANQPRPQHPWHPSLASWIPSGIYNGMIAPETPYTIKGVIWYQGEANSHPKRAPMYARLFPTLIADWRQKWKEGNFPFLYVQISNFESPKEDWGTIRDAQRRTLAVANTAMAVSLDVGQADNVHPPDKQTVGSRLALAARSMVYGEQLEYSGPLFRTATIDGPAMRIWFDHAKDGLTSRGPELEGFEIAGADGKFVPATARIDGLTVVVQAQSVSNPRAVRYAWASFTKANLFNKEGLPASTFTSE